MSLIITGVFMKKQDIRSMRFRPTKKKDDFGLIMDELKNNTSAVSGPSGSGKSTFINRLNKDFNIKTSNISEKTKRGRHTTRHTELLKIRGHTHT